MQASRLTKTKRFLQVPTSFGLCHLKSISDIQAGTCSATPSNLYLPFVLGVSNDVCTSIQASVDACR